MHKNFDGWNQQKKALQKGFEFLSIHEREIWWCSLGLNLGDEEDGKNFFFERPVLVLKKFNNRIAWILPLTSKPKSGNYYHALFYDGNVSTVILSQIRLVSVKRFRRFIRKISLDQFAEIQGKLIELIYN